VPSERISGLRSEQLQNYLRGLLDRKSDHAARKLTLEKAFREISLQDIDLAGSLLYDSPLFSHLGLRDEAIPASLFAAEHDGVFAIRDDVLFFHLRNRVAKNEDSLVALLDGHISLNELVLAGGNISSNLRAIQLIESKGCTLHTFLKLAALHSASANNDGASRVFEELLRKFGYRQGQHVPNIVVDTINWQFDFLRLRRTIEQAYEGETQIAARRSITLPVWMFNPLPSAPSELAIYVKLLWSYSLYDALVYYLSLRDNASSLLSESMVVQFGPDIESAWARLKAAASGAREKLMANREHEDFLFFRASRAFLEDRECLTEVALGQIFYRDAAIPSYQKPKLQTTVTEALRSQETAEDILRSAEGISDQEHNANIFRNSVALTRIVQRGDNLSTLSGSNLAKLMGRTRDIDRLLSVDDLRTLVSAAADELARLIFATLLRARSDQNWDSFRFKKVLQNYVRKNANGSLIAFLDHMNELSENIIPYFVQLLDETTISQLHQLITSARMVYETRIEILDWHAQKFNDENSRHRALQLRVDRKIDNLRGTINEARLNIDSPRFCDWIADRHLSDIVTWLRDPTFSIPDFASISRNSKNLIETLELSRDPNSRGLLALLEIYREFCVNPHFGITSYLGRRIRHGSMKGTLLNGLKAVRTDREFYPLRGTSSIAEFDRWTIEYEQQVNAIVGKLHFNDKRDRLDGLLSSTIVNAQQWNILRGAAENVARAFKLEGHFHGVPMNIEHLCWLVLEVELDRIQRVLRDKRPNWGMFAPDNPDWFDDQLLKRFCSRVNGITDANFQTCISWFRKPTNISPSALFSDVLGLVLAETRDRFPEFSPKIVESGLSELTLSGTLYYLVYDALYVIIVNAAEHGDPTGQLVVDIQIEEREAGRAATLTVTSKLLNSADAQKVKERLTIADKSRVEEADLISKGSGLLKLQSMRARGQLDGLEVDCCVEDRSVLARLDFRLEGLHASTGR
jgi:hypothetical protein